MASERARPAQRPRRGEPAREAADFGPVRGASDLPPLEAILEATSDAHAVLRTDGAILALNVAGRRLFGLGDDPAQSPSSWLDLWSGEERASSLAALLTASAGRPGFFQGQGRFGGKIRWVDVEVRPIGAAGEPARHLLAVARDSTSRHWAEEAVAQQKAILAIAQEAGRIGTFVWDLATDRVHASDEYCRLWGLRIGQPVPGDVLAGLVYPDDRSRFDRFRLEGIELGGGAVECRICKADTGEERWIALRGQIMRDREDRPLRTIGAAYDVTDQKRAEEQKRLLLEETSHRLKNMLAMVQAIANQTLREDASIAEARSALTSRLAALGSAQDLLLEEAWTGADLVTLIAAATRPHGGAHRFKLDGEAVRLASKPALSLALALHELATNAAKHGALGAESGEVRIAWTVDRSGSVGRLRLTWSEHGGPDVAAPSRRGFGTRLLSRAFTGEYGGAVDLAFPPTGVVCTIEIPLVPDRAEGGG